MSREVIQTPFSEPTGPTILAWQIDDDPLLQALFRKTDHQPDNRTDIFLSALTPKTLIGRLHTTEKMLTTLARSNPPLATFLERTATEPNTPLAQDFTFLETGTTLDQTCTYQLKPASAPYRMSFPSKRNVNAKTDYVFQDVVVQAQTYDALDLIGRVTTHTPYLTPPPPISPILIGRGSSEKNRSLYHPYRRLISEFITGMRELYLEPLPVSVRLWYQERYEHSTYNHAYDELTESVPFLSWKIMLEKMKHQQISTSENMLARSKPLRTDRIDGWFREVPQDTLFFRSLANQLWHHFQRFPVEGYEPHLDCSVGDNNPETHQTLTVNQFTQKLELAMRQRVITAASRLHEITRDIAERLLVDRTSNEWFSQQVHASLATWPLQLLREYVNNFSLTFVQKQP